MMKHFSLITILACISLVTACNEVDNGYADYYSEDDPMYWISPNKNTVLQMVKDRVKEMEK